jgi:hypothetical protein
MLARTFPSPLGASPNLWPYLSPFPLTCSCRTPTTTQAITQLPSCAAPGARQRPCFASSARSARDKKVGLILLGTLNREEGNSSTGPPFDFPPSRRARNEDPPLRLPPPPHHFSSCGRTALYCARGAVVSELSCHCKHFVRALGTLALLTRHHSTPSP